MDINKINEKSNELIACHISVANSAQAQNITLQEETVQKYATSIFIAMQPKQQRSYGGGGQRKPDVPKDQQKGAPQGQVMQEGAQCGHCGQALKLSSKGNPYCKCWYEAKQAMPPMAQGPQPTGF